MALPFTSKALLANLQQTKVEEIKYDPKYDLLINIFKDFPALEKQASFHKNRKWYLHKQISS